MKRLLALARLALGGILRRPGKSAALVLGLALTTAASSAVYLLAESVRSTSERLVGSAPALTVQHLVAGRPALLSEADLDRLAAIPSVRSARPRVWGYLYQPALEANVVVLGLDAGALGEVSDEGSALGVDDVIVGGALARSLGLRSGDRLAVISGASEAHVLAVRAVLSGAVTSSHGDVILCALATARALLDVPDGAIVDVALDVFPPEEAPIVARHVTEAIEGARVIDREGLSRRRSLTFEARAGLLSATLLPLLLSFLMLAWERMSGMGDAERREIGILKAIGFSTGDVLVTRAIEVGWLALTGTGIGLLAGYGYVFGLAAPGLADGYFGWSNLRPSLLLVPTFDLETVVFVLAAVVIPFVAAGIVPAWRAAILDPDRAIRGDT